MLLFSWGVHLFSKNETLEAPEFSVKWRAFFGMLGEKGEAGSAKLPALNWAENMNGQWPEQS